MGKKLIAVLFWILVILMITKEVLAFNEAGSSATISPTAKMVKSNDDYDSLNSKRKAIREILVKHNSPLLSEVETFLKVCIKYDIDCYLLPSIAGTESTFGKFMYPESHNPFGWGGGYIMFDSYADCIETVGKYLRLSYYNRGADNIEKIAPIYAESPTWASKVTYFHNQLTKIESQKPLYFGDLGVK